MVDQLVRAVHRPLAIRIVAAVTTGLSAEAGRRHRASAAATCALSRALSSGLLLSTLTKGGERVTIQILGSGPLRGLTVDAYDDGSVRGYPIESQAQPERSMNGRQRLANLVGHEGVVNVLRDVGRDRYQGQVSLSTGEVDEDVEAYLRDSEQIPSALGCETVMDEGGAVLRAGGFLAQVMPGGSVEMIREAQHALRTGALYDLLRDRDVSAEDIAGALLPGLAIEVLDRRELCFRCRCDPARIEGMLLTLTPLELSEMVAEGRAEITCNYCNQRYDLDQEALTRILAQRRTQETN